MMFKQYSRRPSAPSNIAAYFDLKIAKLHYSPTQKATLLGVACNDKELSTDARRDSGV